jgi:predicted O-methyltransferase YrrM
MSYIYTKDWFSFNIRQLDEVLKKVSELNMVLEIGSYEGRSTVYFAERLNEKGKIVCVDTWMGGKEHTVQDMTGVIDRFKHNIKIACEERPDISIEAYQSKSSVYLAKLLDTGGHEQFDLIYIDGSHQSHDVLTDACMSFPLLKHKGIMVFDDYVWGNPAAPLDNPKIAIDAFTTIFGQFFDLVLNANQVVLQRNMRK